MLDMMKVDDIHVHYEHRIAGPDKPSLVFLNSLGTDFRVWAHCVAAFERDYNVLLYDKRGHGLSEAAGARSSIADHAGDLLGLADGLAIDKMILVGLSIGGLIAQEVCHRRPDKVTALILSNTGTKVGSDQAWNDRIGAVREGGVGSIADAVLERWFALSFKARHPDRLAAARSMLTSTSDAGYIAACTALRDADLTDKAADIAVPTLCIAGSEDQATPAAQLRAMSASIPGAAFTLLDDVGHIPCLENEEAYCRMIFSFLQTNG